VNDRTPRRRQGAKRDDKKRTSKNTDERNPTRSGIDYPSPKFRARNPAEEPEKPARASLRKVERKKPHEAPAKKRAPRKRTSAPPRRRNVKTTEATEELARLAGRNARRAQEQLARAAEAYSAGRERDAMKMLRPLRDAYPDASAVRELMGLCHYRIGQYQAAAKELEAFVELTDSAEQHPVLMDCYRAQRRWKRVDETWAELGVSSPSAELVTEGRIVLAGSLADRGRLDEAIQLLSRKSRPLAKPRDHHLRLWYALADLEERAGNLPAARELFARIRRVDPDFADVAARSATLR
jgi:tetratricopeptide (TPR) repeat protein